MEQCSTNTPMQWNSVKAVLIDISGVLYNPDGGDGCPVPGSVEAVEILQSHNFPFKLLTNESQSTRCHLAKKLQKLGFALQESDIITPAAAARSLLLQRGWRAQLLVHPDYLPDLKDVSASAESADCVLLGDAAEGFHFAALNSIFQSLMRHRRLLSLGKGRFYQQAGSLHLDVGAFTSGLEFAASCVAEVVGKPAPEYFLAGAAELAIAELDQVAMIGDDIVSDVAGAQKAGMRGVQVRTGKFRSSTDEPHASVTPDAYADNLLAAVKQLLQL